MKLLRIGQAGQEKPAILHNDQYLDVSGTVEDYNEDFFQAGGVKKLEESIKSNSFQKLKEPGRIGPPVARPSKIICVGLNYAKHAEESGMDLPEEPVLFFKSTTAIIGPNDQVIIPKSSEKTDWEVELALVIGKRTSYVSVEDAMDHVLGYMIHNDVSERTFQLERGGQWVKGKSCDTFAPIGPYLATKEEVPDPHNLNLWLKVNDKIMQSSNTSDLIFDLPYLVSYISQYMTLLPGDIISTGTPFGVGLGLNPPTYLKPGDTMELGIDGLGVMKQKVLAYEG